MEEPSEALSAAELKACGNEAYQRQDFSGAVEHWNQALRQFVEEMTPGTVRVSVGALLVSFLMPCHAMPCYALPCHARRV